MGKDVRRDALQHLKAVAKLPLHHWDNMTVNQKSIQVTLHHHQRERLLFTSYVRSAWKTCSTHNTLL